MENLDKVYAERIAQEYAPKTTTKVMQLQKLDKMVKTPAITVALVFGILGALVLGSGMSFIMTDFGPKGDLGFTLGIIFGVVGILLCGISYPLYAKILKSRKEKYAFEIITLAKEISELESNK